MGRKKKPAREAKTVFTTIRSTRIDKNRMIARSKAYGFRSLSEFLNEVGTKGNLSMKEDK